MNKKQLAKIKFIKSIDGAINYLQKIPSVVQVIPNNFSYVLLIRNDLEKNIPAHFMGYPIHIINMNSVIKGCKKIMKDTIKQNCDLQDPDVMRMYNLLTTAKTLCERELAKK